MRESRRNWELNATGAETQMRLLRRVSEEMPSYLSCLFGYMRLGY